MPPIQAQPARIEHRPASERNGYLDPDQTLVNFCVREMGYSFDRIIKEDPNRLLRSWGKVYRKAKTTAIGTTVLGMAAVTIGVVTGATPMLIAGVLVAGGSGLLVKKHSAGVESCEVEHEMLDEFRPVLGFLSELERRGVNPSDLVSLYDRVVRKVSVNPGRFSTASILQNLFKEEIAQSGVLAQVSGVRTGLAAVAPVETQPSQSCSISQGSRSMGLPQAIGTTEAETPIIGANTRLGAVEVPAAAALEKDAPLVVGTKSLLLTLKEDPKSSFFAAPARTGKGVVIAAAIRIVQKRVVEGTLTHVAFWAITPKQDATENWYWATCDKFFNPDIENGDRALAARGIYDFIKAFTALPRTPQSPTILVVDELTRLVGLLKGIKMEAVDPELFAGDSKTFGDWLLDKLIYSASMSQSVGFYVWVATPSAAVGKQGFSKSDIDSLNIYTLVTKDNLKFADGGSAAFSAPKTDANHPVFSRGHGAGYSHQHQRWYHIEDMSKQVAALAAQPPMRLTNYWIPDSMQVQTSSGVTATPYGHLEKHAPVTLLTEESFESEDPILDLIAEVPDRDKREALMIGYQWATKRRSEGKEINKASFCERARKDRNCAYLRDKRDAIWNELSGLIF